MGKTKERGRDGEKIKKDMGGGRGKEGKETEMDGRVIGNRRGR